MTSTSGSACPEKFHPHVYFLFSLNYLFQSGYSLGCRHPPATSTALMARIQNICIFIKNIHIFIKNGKNAKYLHFHIFINNGKNTKYMSFDGSLTFTLLLISKMLQRSCTKYQVHTSQMLTTTPTNTTNTCKQILTDCRPRCVGWCYK